MRHAILDPDDNVTNVVELPDDYDDPTAEGAWHPPEGHSIEPDPNFEASPGGRWTGSRFEAPPGDQGPDHVAAMHDAIRAANTLDELRAALLPDEQTGRPGAAPVGGRP